MDLKEHEWMLLLLQETGTILSRDNVKEVKVLIEDELPYYRIEGKKGEVVTIGMHEVQELICRYLINLNIAAEESK